MFLGTYTPELDEKRRLILPARFRETLEGGLVVTHAQERVLAVYPKNISEALIAPVSVAPLTLKQVHDYQCMLTVGASFEVPDRQGRITIPPTLRPYTGLERDVVMIGAMNGAEVWDAEHWAEYQVRQELGLAELDAELLSQLGQ